MVLGIGDILKDRYKIIEIIGRGGFGTTYKAQDMQMAEDFLCVVKELDPQRKDPRSLEIAKNYFLKEAKVLQKLGEHPQIPRLLAYFEVNQEFYLVQELIEGEVLSNEFRRKKLNESEAMDLLLDILETLVFVQENNVIHRDIKPENLIRRSKDGKIVVIDFGVV